MTFPPILRSRPCLVVGMPILWASLILRPLIPIALFQENESPGMFFIVLKLSVTYSFFLEFFVSF